MFGFMGVSNQLTVALLRHHAAFELPSQRDRITEVTAGTESDLPLSGGSWRICIGANNPGTVSNSFLL